jgi:hypothetical protein
MATAGRSTTHYDQVERCESSRCIDVSQSVVNTCGPQLLIPVEQKVVTVTT